MFLEIKYNLLLVNVYTIEYFNILKKCPLLMLTLNSKS